MGEHTPGPWTVTKAEVGYNFREVVAPGFGVVCEVGDWSAHNEANARLIAAAPDLLAALKAAVAELDEKTYGEDLCFDHDQMRAAIAKAEAAQRDMEAVR